MDWKGKNLPFKPAFSRLDLSNEPRFSRQGSQPAFESKFGRLKSADMQFFKEEAQPQFKEYDLKPSYNKNWGLKGKQFKEEGYKPSYNKLKGPLQARQFKDVYMPGSGTNFLNKFNGILQESKKNRVHIEKSLGQEHDYQGKHFGQSRPANHIKYDYDSKRPRNITSYNSYIADFQTKNTDIFADIRKNKDTNKFSAKHTPYSGKKGLYEDKPSFQQFKQFKYQRPRSYISQYQLPKKTQAPYQFNPKSPVRKQFSSGFSNFRTDNYRKENPFDIKQLSSGFSNLRSDNYKKENPFDTKYNSSPFKSKNYQFQSKFNNLKSFEKQLTSLKKNTWKQPVPDYEIKSPAFDWKRPSYQTKGKFDWKEPNFKAQLSHEKSIKPDWKRSFDTKQAVKKSPPPTSFNWNKEPSQFKSDYKGSEPPGKLFSAKSDSYKTDQLPFRREIGSKPGIASPSSQSQNWSKKIDQLKKKFEANKNEIKTDLRDFRADIDQYSKGRTGPDEHQFKLDFLDSGKFQVHSKGQLGSKGRIKKFDEMKGGFLHKQLHPKQSISSNSSKEDLKKLDKFEFNEEEGRDRQERRANLAEIGKRLEAGYANYSPGEDN